MTRAEILTLDLEGLHCASCAGRVEAALSGLPGVARAEVNLATGTLRLTHGGADLARIVAALEAAGTPPRVETLRIAITGLNCASCVSRAEAALIAVPGVLSAAVNLPAEAATLTALAGTDAAAGAEAALADAGFGLAQTSSAPAQEDRHVAEAGRLRQDTIVAGLLTAPVFVMEMGGHLFPALHHLIASTIGLTASWWIQLVLTTLVLAGPGRDFFRLGLPALLRRAPDMNALVAMGTGAAYLYSLVATVAPALLPLEARAVYFEAAAVIVTLILLGRTLEARAKGRAGAAIARLIALQPDTALRVEKGAVQEVPLAALRVGDRVRILPGARIAVDGVVASGASHIDASMVTGEPIPVAKTTGDPVLAGTVNGPGALEITVTALGEDATLARIVRLVRDAQGGKLPIQALVDGVTARFVPAVMIVALITVSAWLALGPTPAHALVAGVSVLIIACPCAMGLATPLSIMVATGRAAELGVLFRKGEALQRLAEADLFAFDKTGTLTLGLPRLTALEPATGVNADAALAKLAALEAQSEHPLGAATVAAARARGLTIPAAEGAEAVPGAGIRGKVGDDTLIVGTAVFLESAGVSTAHFIARATSLAEEGATVLYAAINGAPALLIGFTDPPKPGAPTALGALMASGAGLAMITGDGPATARAVADRLGIDRVTAGVRPEGKVAAIEELAAEGRTVAFVGDGINDAPALATAHTGIALGTGTDIAIEGADVVLMSGDLGGVVTARTISCATLRNIKQNLFWAFGYNAALIPVAAGLLYPATGLMLSPALAAGAMALSSLFVVANALRLRRTSAPDGPAPPGPTLYAREANA